MPYAPPAQAPSPTLPVHSPGRARHRRSYSDAPSGPGAFAPLGVPSRGHGHRTASTGTFTTTPHGGPKFHFKNDQETSSQSDSESDSDHGSHPYPPVKLKARLSPTLSLSTAGSGNVPFPSSKGSPIKTYSPQLLSPNVHSASNLSSGTNSPRPNFPRTNSTPIFLSNGKPLKSSLKSSSSSPAISPTHSPAHTRHASAPNTPGPSYSSSSSSISTPTTPATPHKNVHFPREEEGQQLASVRIYSRSARPASISLPLSQSMEDTETETETDREYFRQPSAMSSANFAVAGSSSMPFPRMTKLPARSRSQTLPSGAPTAAPTLNPSSMSTSASQKKVKKVWELDNLKCSAIPSHSPSVYGNVHLESLTLVSASSSASPSPTSPTSPTPTGSPQVTLRGSLLVRNLAFEKTVAVRFTLDEWETTSEVVAHHVTSLGSLPRKFFKAGDGLASVDADTTTPPASDDDDDKENKASTTPTWDRFSFQIKLDDYAPSLGSRTMWMVARYSVPYVHSRAHSLDDLASFAALVSNGSMSGSAASSLSLAMAAKRASAGEWEMGMTKMGVVAGQAGEWWDNNNGGNYRVLFRTKEIEATSKPSLTLNTSTETPTPTQEATNGKKKAFEVDSSDEEEEARIKKGGKNELGLRGMERERKNGGSYPFPITKPSVGAPTITFSPASPPANSYFPPQPPLAPALSRPTAQQQAQMAKETANARAKTTLQHLRGLSLKNYAAPKVSAPAHTPPPVMQRSRSASPSLEPNTGATTTSNSIGLGPAPGAQERERSASTSAIPASATTPTGAREITPSMMNMNVAAEGGPGVSMLSSSPGMSTSPELMRFGGGSGFGRRWGAPSSTISGVSTATANPTSTATTAGGNDDDKSDTSSTSSNSTSETPPLLSPLMSPVVEFSSFAFDHSHSPPGTMSFAGMFGGFPATIVGEPQADIGAEMDGHYSPYHSRSHGEDDAAAKHMQHQRQDSHQQDGGFSLYWPWGAQRRFDAEKDQGEEEREEHVGLVSPSPSSNASTITPGTEDGPSSPAATTFKLRQPSPQPASLRRLVDSHNGNSENKPKRPHSPLSNAALNRAAIKRPGTMSRESSLESIPELAKAAAASGPAPALPHHITNKPYTSSPLSSPVTSPRGSPRGSPHGSRSPSPLEPPLSPGSVATDSAYQAFVKKWCFAQGPGAVSVGDVRG